MNPNRFLLLASVAFGFVSCVDKHKSKESVEVIENTEVTKLPYFNLKILRPLGRGFLFTSSAAADRNCHFGQFRARQNTKFRFSVAIGMKPAKYPYGLPSGIVGFKKFFISAIFTPEWEKATHEIPEFSFTNQKGEAVTNKTFESNIYVANFFFTICPGI